MKRIHALQDWPVELQEAAQRAVASGDTQSSLLCPACAGGQSGEFSLSLWHNGAFVVAHCWRNACGYSADVPHGSTKLGKPRFKPRRFEGDLYPVDSSFGRAIVERWCLRRAVSVRGEGLWMPVYGPDGQQRGAVIKYFDGQHPKTVAYKQTDLPWQAWYVHVSAVHK